jgi:outer membrane protein assembly factor BamB
LQVLCYDAGSGKQLWARTVHSGEVYDEVHRVADYATCAPATDGKYVYVSFGAEGYYKVDLNGNQIWKADLGKIDTLGYGYGPSPVLLEGKVIILPDQDDSEKSFIAALSTADGRVVWKTPRKMTNTWGTPALVDVSGRKQLIVNGGPNVVAYDPKDGKELWRTEGPNGVVVHTPVFGAGMVFASVGYPRKNTLAVRLIPAAGENRVAWSYTKGTSYVPSPLFYYGYLYLMSDSGMLTCLDAKTGEAKYEAQRLPDPSKFTSSSGGVSSACRRFDLHPVGQVAVSNTPLARCVCRFSVLQMRFGGQCGALPTMANGRAVHRGRWRHRGVCARHRAGAQADWPRSLA